MSEAIKKRIKKFIQKYNLKFKILDIKIEISNSVSTAAMSFNGSDFIMKINDEFIEKYDLNDHDISFIISHEIMHRKGGDLFRYFEHNMNDIDKMVANIVLDGFINSKITNRNGVLNGTTIFDKLYDKNKFPSVFLYHSSLISYDEKEVKTFIENVMKKNGFNNQDAMILGEIYTDIWYRKCTVLSAYSRLRPYFLKEKQYTQLVFIGESNGEFRYRENDSIFSDLNGSSEDGINTEAYFIKEEWRGVYRAISAAITEGNRERSRAIDFVKQSTVIPKITRRTIFLNYFKIRELIFFGSLPMITDNNIEINIFVDVSGSFREIYPFVLGFLSSIQDIKLKKIFQFTTQVNDISYREFKDGKIKGDWGTDINPVIKKALDDKMKKIVIFTDGEFGGIKPRLRTQLKSSGMNIYTVLMNKFGNHRLMASPIEKHSRKLWKVKM